MITVVNKHYHIPTDKDYYVGRPSALGNPYATKPSKVAAYRAETSRIAISHYAQWLARKIEQNDLRVVTALKAIPLDANLVCWCAPRPCHASVIKEFLEMGTISYICSEGDCYGRGRWTTDCGVSMNCFACNGTGYITETIKYPE